MPLQSDGSRSKTDALSKEGTLNSSPEKVRDPKFREGEFFDPRDAIQSKYEMLRRVRVDGLPVAHAARSFGFNGHTDVVPAGYAVAVSLDTSALVAAGQMLGTCDDLRVVSFDGVSNTELDRVVEGCGTATTQIWFALARPIGASGMDENYYLYYGNPLAGVPPADGMSIFVFFEDWEQGTAHWTGAGGRDPGNTGTMGLSVISTAEAFSPDHSRRRPRI